MGECVWKGKDGVCILHSHFVENPVIEFCVEGPCPDEEEDDGDG